MTETWTQNPEGLRESVQQFRDPSTEQWERDYIQKSWEEAGIPNQFAAMIRAAEMKRGEAPAS